MAQRKITRNKASNGATVGYELSFGKWLMRSAPSRGIGFGGKADRLLRRRIRGRHGYLCGSGLQKPDISILSDEFLAEIRGMPRKNLAVELLRKLLNGEIQTRRKKNVVQAKSFAAMLEQSIRKYRTELSKQRK